MYYGRKPFSAIRALSSALRSGRLRTFSRKSRPDLARRERPCETGDEERLAAAKPLTPHPYRGNKSHASSGGRRDTRAMGRAEGHSLDRHLGRQRCQLCRLARLSIQIAVRPIALDGDDHPSNCGGGPHLRGTENPQLRTCAVGSENHVAGYPGAWAESRYR